MTNDLAIRNETPLAAYQAYADETLATAIAGDLLKFAKGDWLRGEGKDLVPADAMFVCHMQELWQGWTKWLDGAPVDHRINRIGDNIKIQRNELGDLDESNWEKDANGAPRDPWQMTDRLIMKDDCTKDLVTFVTGSYGGRHGLAKLCRTYAREASKQEGRFPVVTLGVDKTWRHSDYGIIPRPQFNIVGWAYWDDEAGGAAKPKETKTKNTSAPTPTPDDPRTLVGKELNDSIPF